MKKSISSISIIFLIFILYSNSFTVVWQLDDPPNITENNYLTINNLLPETLWNTFFAKPYSDGQLYRPIANLSFALNWYFGQDKPFGYHLVNLLIHILTALFLYKTTLLLLHTPSLKNNQSRTPFLLPCSAPLFGPSIRFKPKRLPILFNAWPQ